MHLSMKIWQNPSIAIRVKTSKFLTQVNEHEQKFWYLHIAMYINRQFQLKIEYWILYYIPYCFRSPWHLLLKQCVLRYIYVLCRFSFVQILFRKKDVKELSLIDPENWSKFPGFTSHVMWPLSAPHAEIVVSEGKKSHFIEIGIKLP